MFVQTRLPALGAIKSISNSNYNCTCKAGTLGRRVRFSDRVGLPVPVPVPVEDAGAGDYSPLTKNGGPIRT